MTTEEETVDILVFHKTSGYRHDSIMRGIQTIEELAATHGMTVADSDDASWLSGPDLSDVVVFLNTTGDVLDSGQQDSFEEYMASGGGFVGIHAATDTEYDWPWYGELVGTYFADHPAPQRATVENSKPGLDDLTDGLPDSFELRDEWYNFRSMPGPDITVLAFVDESSYEGGTMGARHPIAWAHEYEGGKAVYLGFGHTTEAFDHEAVRTLLINGIEWAASS